MQLLQLIKQAAVEAVEAEDPTKVWIGEVIQEAPLQIKIDQKIILDKEFLVLSQRVTNHEIQMEVNHVTEKMSGGAKDPSFQSHLHQYKGVKTFKVLNALKKGEKVIVVSAQGGQRFVVFDRVGVI